jgi:hypothetical protein
MDEKEIDLGSVNWTQGMLLTPEHFLRQERYTDSALLWALRYATSGHGLVGSGMRADAADRGAGKHDPAIEIDDNGDEIKVSLSDCRAISPSGDIIEISPAHPIHQSFPKSLIEGRESLGVYVVCEPHEKIVEDNGEDTANPQVKSTRRRTHRIQLDVTGAEAPHSVQICRLRKVEGSFRYERSSDFIPICTTLIGHSELKRAWERLRDGLIALSDRYLRLNKAIVEYIAVASNNGLSTTGDLEVLQFVGRMTTSLESGAYDALDPLQSPQRFLQQLFRLVRSASVYLDLSPPTREYFRELSALGVAEIGLLLEQEQEMLSLHRELSIHDNLREEIDRIEAALGRLSRLEEALEGKYLDYRISAALEALPFFFDRRSEDPALYESQARPARPQLFGDDLSFVFAPLRLDGRQNFRVVLIRENDASFDVGSTLSSIVLINQGAGQGREPIYPKAVCELPDQRNFAVDFRVPADVHTISDLRITVNAASRIRSGLLYTRRFITPGTSRAIAAPMLPTSQLRPSISQALRAESLDPLGNPSRRPEVETSDPWPTDPKPGDSQEFAQPKRRRRLE